MDLHHKALVFFACLCMAGSFSETHAQNAVDMQKSIIKKQVQFDDWERILSTKNDVSYNEFEVTNDMVEPWQIQRTQKIVGGRCSVVQYILATTDDPKKATEIIRVSVTRCPLRDNAVEKLVDHLLGVQRPDFTFIDNKAMTVGDISVHIPGEPEPSLLFVRGNIFIAVESAGEMVTGDIRKLALALDDSLSKRQQ